MKPVDVRASDQDRERVAQRLLIAVGEGRLDLNEYDERVKLAYSAKTYVELAPLTADLPPVAPPPVPRQLPGRPYRYGAGPLPPVLLIMLVALVLALAAGFTGSFLLFGLVVWALVRSSYRHGARH